MHFDLATILVIMFILFLGFVGWTRGAFYKFQADLIRQHFATAMGEVFNDSYKHDVAYSYIKHQFNKADESIYPNHDYAMDAVFRELCERHDNRIHLGLTVAEINQLGETINLMHLFRQRIIKHLNDDPILDMPYTRKQVYDMFK